MSYKLFGANVSPFVRKVRMLLAEKGLAYEYTPVSPFSPPDGWRDISPLGKIPAFQDGDKTLVDSSVICLYVERCHPAPAMYPADPYPWARALWFEEYMDSGLIPVAGPLVFRPLVIAPLMGNQPVTAEAKAAAHKVVAEQIHPMWDYLEKELGDRTFFVGDSLSIADIAVASGHVNLRHADVEPDAARWPALAAFLTRLYARPTLAALLDEESPRWDKREALRAV